ncbi:peroxiredoxin family protein [Pontibacter litorisediminis]|uniref:peroxiredoxin family protein n=1 Tax=Pontibacter litorisediminis TaxID=1846260 RepID=UPI0023EAA982|nr:TlpA disulfide reductase family protein [Pontibacter litorisediminis]
MKKLKLLPLLLLLAVNQLMAQGKAVISGKIYGPLSDQVVLVMYPNPLLPQEVKTEAKLTGNTFRLEVPVQKPMVAELVHGDEVAQVYLEPGYELQLSTSGKGFLKSLKYKGAGANENNYLARYTYRFEEEEEYQALPDNVKLKEKEFTAFLDDRRSDQRSSLEKYTAQKQVSEEFRDFLLAEIEFSYALDKLHYHPLRQQVLQVALTKPSAAFYNFLHGLDLQNPANLRSPAFISFLRSYTSYQAKESGYSEKDPQYFKARYDAAAQQLEGLVKLAAQAQVLQQSVQQGHLKYTELMLQDFEARNHDQAVSAYLSRVHAENTSLVAGGMAPDFKLRNIAGDTISLSDFRGNLVYLNFWRSDCGLCHVELPHLQRLTARMGSHKVVFLNVAVGDSEEQWRQLVREKELQGVHVLATGATDVAKQYGLKDVPAYFLIDEEGRILRLKARRPSDHEAANDILQQLEVRQASLR